MSIGAAGTVLHARRVIPVGMVLFGISAVAALVLALPGQTVATRYLGDLFLLLDQAYRVSWGQVPNRDFHTPLGPLVSYVPAAGYWLSGSLGTALPIGMGLVTLTLAPAIVHILATRLHPLLAGFYGAFLLLILAVPINLGEGVTALSFGKFYNRIGWVGLGALLILYLRPRRGDESDAVDSFCAAVLTLVLVYTKATFALVAVGFLVLMLLDSWQRRWAAGALGLIVATALVVEAFWRSSLAYISDLQLALAASGWLRGSWGQIADHVLINLADYVLVSLFAVLALRYTRSVRDALFYLTCGVVGFLLVNQSFQAWGIITLHAAAAVAAETILRHEDGSQRAEDAQRWSGAAGAKLLFIALVLPTAVHCTLALGLHAASAVARAGAPLPLAGFDRVRFANLWTWGDHDAGAAELVAIRDGASALAALDPPPERVVVLDLTNPFSAGLGLRPPHGDASWLQWERTISSSASWPASDLLADADLVLEAKPLPESDAAKALEAGRSPAALYRPALAEQFEVIRETGRWIVHRRKTARRSGCLSCDRPVTNAAFLP
jgi:hypothetical protein